VELFSSQTLGAKIYLGFIIALMLFLAFYFYKNRSNLPLPMDVTKESMEEYQKKQLRRYLNSLSSMIWWGILPLGHGYLGVLLLRGLSGFSNILGTILLVVLLVWVYRQNKIWFEKYNKQYVKLGGKITVWFSL